MRVMWTLRSMVLAMAVIGLMATGAQADLVLIDSGDDLPTGNVSEAQFVEDLAITPETDLIELNENLFTIVSGGPGSTTAEIEWDLTNSEFELRYVLVVDGGLPGQPPTQIWNLYEAINGQGTGESNGPQLVECCDGLERNISHLTFIGTDGRTPPGEVPEPATLVLLGVGLVGTALLRRRAR